MTLSPFRPVLIPLLLWLGVWSTPSWAAERADPSIAASSARKSHSKKKKVRKAPAAAPAAAALPDAPTADSAPPDAPAAATAPSAAPSATDNLDFNLLEESGAKSPAAKAAALALNQDIETQVGRRRQMLYLHQTLGLAMLGSLVVTEVVGQLNLDDKFLGGRDRGTWQLLHIGLATSTLALFFSVGMLGLFAPTPYPKRLVFDTTTVHRACMALATAGMIAQLILGMASAGHEGSYPQQRNFVTAHQVVGYATLGATAVGATTLVF